MAIYNSTSLNRSVLTADLPHLEPQELQKFHSELIECIDEITTQLQEVSAFEEKIAALEGGIGAVATSSGMAAQFLTFAALTGTGDHVVASSALYGGTLTQLDVTLRRFGVDTTFNLPVLVRTNHTHPEPNLSFD